MKKKSSQNPFVVKKTRKVKKSIRGKSPYPKPWKHWYQKLRWDRLVTMFIILALTAIMIVSILGGIKSFCAPEPLTREDINQILDEKLKGLQDQDTTTQQDVNKIREEIEALKTSKAEKKAAEEQAAKEAEALRIAQAERKVQVTSRGGSSIRTSSATSGTSLGTYRVTTYYPGDGCSSTSTTGSGKTTANFDITKINGANVYTYKGKIVLAAWTKELKATGYNSYNAQSKDTYLFHYNQEVQIKLGGTWYDAIVLDSCGASGWTTKPNLVDIFVPSAGNSPASSCEIRI